MRRRDFLSLCGAGAAAFALRARATSPAVRPAKRLILVFATGGWDTSYALDPKEPPHVDIPAGAVRRFGPLDVFVDASRPGVTRFFERHAEVSTLVRGISVDAINHHECQRRIATGTREETRPDFGMIVAHALGNDLPVPYLILGDVAYTGAYAVSAARVGAQNQLVGLLGGAAGRSTDMSTGDETADVTGALLRDYAEASATRARATRGAMGYNRRRVDDFVEAMQRSDRLRDLRGDLGVPGQTQTMAAQVPLAIDALAQGVSHSVMLSTGFTWDTHFDNELQSQYHDVTFSALADLVDALRTRPGKAAGTKMIDDTVVVAFSEMSRTQHLNSNTDPHAGKNHWPVTTALVIGGGIGSRVLGATDPDCGSLPIDLATGGAGSTRLLYSHFVAGVLAHCGVDPTAYLQSEVLDALV